MAKTSDTAGWMELFLSVLAMIRVPKSTYLAHNTRATNRSGDKKPSTALDMMNKFAGRGIPLVCCSVEMGA